MTIGTLARVSCSTSTTGMGQLVPNPVPLTVSNATSYPSRACVPPYYYPFMAQSARKLDTYLLMK